MTGLRGVRAGRASAPICVRAAWRAAALAIVGWAGPDEPCACAARRPSRRLRDAGGVALGQPAGRAWVRSRFQGPYVRDELMDRGVLVETLETATTWAQLFHACTARWATPCATTRRWSPATSRTSIPRARRCTSRSWRGRGAARSSRSGAEVKRGGVRGDRRRRRDDHPSPRGGPRPRAGTSGAEVGDTGVAALRALKRGLDPAGIMNPGKLLPSG